MTPQPPCQWGPGFGVPKGYKMIPHKVWLPGGFRVTMAHLNPNEMYTKHGEYYDGMLDPTTMHIDLNRKLPSLRKWWIFGQLMRHVVAEYWVPWLTTQGIAKETAYRVRKDRHRGGKPSHTNAARVAAARAKRAAAQGEAEPPPAE